MTGELYDLAYRFRNSKIWKTVFEQELFAVPLADGRTAYCCIMGRSGEHMALSVHIGAEGLSSYRRLVGMDPYEMTEADLYMQDCIQCSVEEKDQLSGEELAGIRRYCQAAGIPFRPPYPQFKRFFPNCVPWQVTDEADLDAIREALRVAVAMAGREKKTLGLRPVIADRDGETYVTDESDLFRQISLFADEADEAPKPADDPVTIPLYRLEDGELRIDRTTLPPYTERLPDAPSRINEPDLHRLEKLPKRGTLQCEVVRLPEPIDGEPPFLPALLLSVDEEGTVLKPTFGKKAVYDPDQLLGDFVSVLVQAELCPEQIGIRTPETEILLKGFCRRAGIRLLKRKRLDLLDEAVDSLMERYQDDEDGAAELVDMLRELDREQIRSLPDIVLRQILDMEQVLPEDIVRKIRKALGK